MDKTVYQKVCEDLKQIIWRNDLTFEELAKRIKVPLSTLKKQLNASDGSLNKLVKICEGLGVDFADLLTFSDKEPAKIYRLSKQQEELFSKDWRLFAFYWFLVFERKKLSSVKRKLKLKDAEAMKYLYRLDKVDLIKVEADNSFTIPDIKYIHWRPKDKFSMGLFKEWSMQIILDGLKGGDKSFYVLQHFLLTPQSRAELHQRLSELEDEFARRTLQELRLYPEKVSSIRCLLGACDGSYIS